jgi:hypothetical protein
MTATFFFICQRFVSLSHIWFNYMLLQAVVSAVGATTAVNRLRHFCLCVNVWKSYSLFAIDQIQFPFASENTSIIQVSPYYSAYECLGS